MELVAFDLEIAKELPEDGDWEPYRPFGITCAALCFEDMRTEAVHNGRGLREYGPSLTPLNARCLARKLASYTSVTWNGVGFDFKVLADACYDRRTQDGVELAKKLALDHIDMGFQMLAELGYMCSLNGLAKALGLPGKTEGMSGEKAPVMWRQGAQAQDLVLEYVKQDAITTMEVYRALLERGKSKWYRKDGTISRVEWQPTVRYGRLLTVRECLELPLPDTSRMDGPWPREKFVGWLNGD